MNFSRIGQFPYEICQCCRAYVLEGYRLKNPFILDWLNITQYCNLNSFPGFLMCTPLHPKSVPFDCCRAFKLNNYFVYGRIWMKFSWQVNICMGLDEAWNPDYTKKKPKVLVGFLMSTSQTRNGLDYAKISSERSLGIFSHNLVVLPMSCK